MNLRLSPLAQVVCRDAAPAPTRKGGWRRLRWRAYQRRQEALEKVHARLATKFIGDANLEPLAEGEAHVLTLKTLDEEQMQ